MNGETDSEDYAEWHNHQYDEYDEWRDSEMESLDASIQEFVKQYSQRTGYYHQREDRIWKTLQVTSSAMVKSKQTENSNENSHN